MKKSIMFIFVMLFMFCVGCLGVKANCVYYDSNGIARVSFNYIPVGTELVAGDFVPNYSSLNVQLNANDNPNATFLRSNMSMTVSSNNYCPEYVGYSGAGHIYISDNVSDLANINEIYTRDSNVGTSTKNNLYDTSYSSVNTTYVNMDNMHRTRFNLITYANGTYGLCVTNYWYDDGSGREPVSACEDFSSLSSIPIINLNGKQFTVSVAGARNLYTTDSPLSINAVISQNSSGVYVLGDTESGVNPVPENPDDDLPIETVNFCEEQGVLKSFRIVGYILFIVKIVIPLILIILGSIDFAKAVISSDDKAPKDAIMSFAKRIVIAIIIFLIPTILNFLLSLVNGASETFNDSNFTNCTDCLFDPFGTCQAE